MAPTLRPLLAAACLGAAAAIRGDVDAKLSLAAAEAAEARGEGRDKQSLGQLSHLAVLTWNAQDFDDKTRRDRANPATKQTRMNDRLYKEVTAPGRPQANIIFLQEVAGCDMVKPFQAKMPSFDCVESHIDRSYEDNSHLVLGNILLYDGDVFEVYNRNRGKTEGWRKWQNLFSRTTDKNGETLADVHEEMCSDPRTGWKTLHGKHECNIGSDAQPSNSALLTLKAGKWTAEGDKAFGAGVRLVNIHLFSGAGSGVEQAVGDSRRAFQFRSFAWRTHIWLEEDKKDGWEPTSTIYAGDYNVANAEALKKVTAEQAADYWAKLWCPLEGKGCSDVQARDLKVTQGRGSYQLPLDHVIMDSRGVRGDLKLSSKSWVGAINYDYSDHAPVLVCIAPSGVAGACGAGTSPKAPEAEGFEAPGTGKNGADAPKVGALAALACAALLAAGLGP